MKIAINTLFGGAPRVSEWHDFMDNDDDYIRLSEIVDVEFVDLPKEEVVPKQVKQIDEKISEARAKFQTAINLLEEQKSKLLAITQVTE